MPVLGLDIGTTCCKCQVFADSGEVMRYEKAEYPAAPGRRDVDLAALWSSVCRVLKSAAAGCEISAICVSSFGESFVAADAEGRPLADPILYSDPRGEEECRQILSRISANEVIAICGVSPHSMYSLPKIMWLKKHRPEIWGKTRRLFLIGDYILYLLTGEAAIDYSLAARTMAFDIREKRWSRRMLEIAEIPEDMLSGPLPSGAPVGRVRREIAGELGLSPSCLAVAGVHDQVGAALGGGALSPGSAVDGTGTVECVTPVFSRPPQAPKMAECGYACVPFAGTGKYVTYAFNFAGGALISWFKDVLMRGHTRLLEREKSDFYAYFESAMPSAPTELLVLPHLLGAGTPYMDSAARGAVLGLTGATGPEELYRALMEGASYEMRVNLEKLSGFGITVSELTVTGGGANSPAWLQIKADVMKVPVFPLASSEAGICGCAMLAETAIGNYPGLYEAGKAFVKRGKPVYPKADNLRRYDELYGRYAKIYTAIKEIMA